MIVFKWNRGKVMKKVLIVIVVILSFGVIGFGGRAKSQNVRKIGL